MALTPEMIANIRGDKPAKVKASLANEQSRFTPEELAEINAVGKKQKAANMSAEDIDRLNASFDAKQKTAKINAEVKQQEKCFCEKLLITPIKTTIINRYNNAKESTAMSCTSLCFILIAVAFFTHIMQKHGEGILKSILRGIAFTLIPLFVLFAYILLLECHMRIACLDWNGNIVDEIYFVYNTGGFIAIFVVSFLLMLFVYKENKK